MIRSERRRQNCRIYSAASKRPCRETDGLEPPQTLENTLTGDVEEEGINFENLNDWEAMFRLSPLSTPTGDSSTPPPLIDLSLTPQREGPAVVDLTCDDDDDEVVAQCPPDHRIQGLFSELPSSGLQSVENARRVAAAVAMAALVGDENENVEIGTTDGLTEGPRRPTRRAQAIEVVDSDNEDDDGEDDDIEELIKSDIRGQQHCVISSSSSANQNDRSSQSVISTITCPVCMDSADQILADKRKLVSTTCGHVFCGKCIRSAIRRQHMCPTCRKRLSLKQFHPIYLT